TPPAAPTVSSSTHPVQTTWYSNNTPTFSWSASDSAPITNYAYVMDQIPTTTPTTPSGTATTYTSPARTDGIWYLHVRAQNAAGLWGATTHYTVKIDATPPNPPTALASTSHV